MYITTLIWEVQFTCFPKWLRIIVNTKFLRVPQFGVFIQICQQVSLSLKLENVTMIFFAFFLRRYLIIIWFWRLLLKWSFWFPLKIFVYLELKKKKKITDIILQISNLNWSLSYCLKLRYIDFFDSNFSNFCFENSIYHMITQSSFKGICLQIWKFRICD